MGSNTLGENLSSTLGSGAIFTFGSGGAGRIDFLGMLGDGGIFAYMFVFKIVAKAVITIFVLSPKFRKGRS